MSKSSFLSHDNLFLYFKSFIYHHRFYVLIPYVLCVFYLYIKCLIGQEFINSRLNYTLILFLIYSVTFYGFVFQTQFSERLI